MAVEFTVMKQEQIDEFLQASHHAILATNRKDGAPQISAVWYLYDDGKMYVTVFADSTKHRNLKRDPRLSVCVDAGHPDARAITIYGTAELIGDPSEWRDDIFFRITRRYLESDEEARKYNEAVDSDADQVLIVVTPAKILARDYN